MTRLEQGDAEFPGVRPRLPAGVAVVEAGEALDLATTAPVPVLLGVTDQGDWVWANDRLVSWLGTEPRGSWAADIHPDDRPACEGTLREAVAAGTGFETEYRRRRAGGRYGWLLERAEPRRNPATAAVTGYIHACIDITARREAEAASEAARERAQRLQAITAALSGAATADEVFDVVLSELVEAVDADGAATTVLNDDGTVLRVRGAVGYEPETVDALREFSVDAPLPLALAVRRRRRVFYPSNAEMLADNPGMDRLVQPTRDRAVVALPLVVADEITGSIGLSWPHPRQLGPEELSFLDAVAGLLAQAYDRARLYQSEARARRFAEHTAQQLAFLAEASRLLSSSLDIDQTLARLADTLVPWLADWCVIHLVDDRGRARPVATTHSDPERVAFVEELQRRWPVRTDASAGAGYVIRTGERQVFEDIPDELLETVAQDEEHLAMIRRVGVSSALSVPLRVQGRVVGAITTANEAGRPLAAGDVALIEEVAVRAAIAVTNAQAYHERSAVASRLQASLLPSRLPAIPGLEVAARYLAAGEGVDVGGDFYDAFPGRGGRWILAIGDVRGKGVEAAAVTGLARHTVRCAALHSRSPRRILADLNTVLLRAEADEADEALVVPRFCTVCLVAVRPGQSVATATVCAAGHPLPMLLTADGRVTEIGRSGSLLGVVDRPDLPERIVRLTAGDALVCFTDGITDRRTGDTFFEDRIRHTLSGLAGLPADLVAERLQDAARTFAVDAPADDMAVIVVRHTGAQ